MEKGLLSREDLDVALAMQKRTKEMLGELLISLGYITETELLKYLASRLHTRFISAEKLAKVKITPMILSTIPLTFAEQNNVLPILYEPEKMQLAVLMSEPQNERLKEDIRTRTKVQEVISYLALKRTIQAGIQKFYRGDQKAFDNLYENPLMSMAPEADTNEALSGQEVMAMQGSPGQRLSDQLHAASLFSDNVYVETLNILVGLLELKPENFRGHSASVARFAKRIGERMGMNIQDIYLLIIASYLHDMGKKSMPHMTLVSLRTEDDVSRAKKFFQAPARLFESIGLPSAVPEILTHLFERYDGRGFPNGSKADEIPLGSRIIALVDSYEELARNPVHGIKNPDDAIRYLRQYNKIFFDPEVFTHFEGLMTENKPKSSADADLTGATVLIVDNNPSDSSFLKNKLTDAKIPSRVVSTSSEAFDILEREEISLIICETDLKPQNGFAFCENLREDAKFSHLPLIFLSRNESTEHINRGFDAGGDDFVSKPYRPEMLLAKVRRYLSKAKTQSQKSGSGERQRGVAGSIKEIPLTDLVQLFSTGRKTGVLELKNNSKEGAIFFDNGDVINAFYDNLTGEKAFYQLIRWEEGEFVLNSEVTLPKQEIQAPTPHLIMEGMRLWDEENAGK